MLNGLPTIKVGNELDEAAGYIVRPVQWSDFKVELTRLDLEAVAEEPEAPVDGALPKNMEFAIVEMGERSETDTDESDDAEEYDYELDNLSIDYHSFTNSEYMKVVDDVQGFHDDDEEVEVPRNVVLVTDDVEAALTKRLDGGSVVEPGNEFWATDVEIYSGRESLLYIKPERDLVYSYSEPGKWVAALRKKTVTKVDLETKWRPSDELSAFPISSLAWANTIATRSGSLARGLDSQTEYILERWPHFDLLELDNMLLKLCTMLFVQPESPYSLMQKSGYSRTVVYGLVNACHELDILRVSDDFDLEKFSEMNADEGVFGKIKEVFRT